MTPAGRLRVGCDLVALKDIEHSLTTFGERFLAKIYTPAEISYCAGRLPQLAARFAAKEAAIKAFAVPGHSFVPREIEIASVDHVPSLVLHGGAAELARRQWWDRPAVSLSHTDCHAAAVVVVAPTAHNAAIPGNH
ncbi:holo-ACP synthase [Mycobacterium sp. C31M]